MSLAQLLADAAALREEPCSRPRPCLHACCIQTIPIPYSGKCVSWCPADQSDPDPARRRHCTHRYRSETPR